MAASARPSRGVRTRSMHARDGYVRFDSISGDALDVTLSFLDPPELLPLQAVSKRLQL